MRLAGIAGLIAGAFSMASGEWISMSAQRELLERELAMEKHEIRHRPEGERRELVGIYEKRGVDPTVARTLADEMMRTPELALETHAREELGINPAALGRPIQAAVSSFATFALGALLPLHPVALRPGAPAAVVASVVVGAVAALGVGAILAAFTRQSWWRSSVRQLLMSAVPWRPWSTASASRVGVSRARTDASSPIAAPASPPARVDRVRSDQASPRRVRPRRRRSGQAVTGCGAGVSTMMRRTKPTSMRAPPTTANHCATTPTPVKARAPSWPRRRDSGRWSGIDCE